MFTCFYCYHLLLYKSLFRGFLSVIYHNSLRFVYLCIKSIQRKLLQQQYEPCLGPFYGLTNARHDAAHLSLFRNLCFFFNFVSLSHLDQIVHTQIFDGKCTLVHYGRYDTYLIYLMLLNFWKKICDSTVWLYHIDCNVIKNCYVQIAV